MTSRPTDVHGSGDLADGQTGVGAGDLGDANAAVGAAELTGARSAVGSAISGDASITARRSPGPNSTEWPELLARVSRGWRTVAAAGVAAVLTAAALWWLEGAHYHAQATLALTRPDATLAFDERFRSAPVDPTFPYRIGSIRTYPELALTDDIAGRVLAAFGERLPAGWTAVKLRSRVRVLAAAEGTLLVVEARARQPKLAADIANMWAEVFSRRMEELLGATAGSAEEAALDRSSNPEVAPGLPAARATARAALEVSESALEAFHVDASIDARTAELNALESRYRSLLARRDRLDDVARDADRMAERLESGGVSGAGEALALLLLRFETLIGGSDGVIEDSETGGVSLRFDAASGTAPRAADLRALALDAADAGEAASREAEGLPERLAAARSTLAVVSHERADLERERDLASERLQALGRREAEVEAAAATSRPELRLAAAAVPPAGIDIGPLLGRVLAALVLGVLAGAALAIRAPGPE